ncbi:TonB-dependent receptor [Pseudoalteromonas luteoviolacea]|nr:TonB-dependent receptor [Pseudoalteromonas luteoviolacea]
MRTVLPRVGLSALSAAILSAVSLPSFAAEEAQAKKNTFEKIEVTARKRTESLFETPTAITSIGSDAIEKGNMSNLDDIGKFVPNLNITRYGVGNAAHASVFIRGIGLQDHIITTDPGVGVYVDGVYLGRQMGSNLSLPNIERVEVLRGPQGTLYGRNTLGGAVNIITKKPGSEDVVRIESKVGSRGRLGGDIYTNQTINDEWSFAANASYKERDGVGRAVNLAAPEKEIGEEQEMSGRFAIKWQPSSDFSLNVAVDAVENESGQSPYTIELTGGLDPNDPNNGDFPLLNASLLPENPDDLGTTVAGIESTDYSGWGASVIADWQVSDEYAVKFITSKRGSDYTGGLDDDASPLHLSEFPEEGGADQFSIEFQLNGTFDSWDFVSGLYYFNEDGFTESAPYVFSPFSVPGNYGRFRIDQETDSYAAYFNASFDVTEKLSLGGGLRYSEDEKDAFADFRYFKKGAQAKFDEVTWDVNVAYQLNRDMNVYAQIQKGYQSGGFPPRPFGGADAFVSFDETKALNYEIGFKGQVHDQVSMMLALFVTDYTDLALPFNDPSNGFNTYIENAGESRAQGIELETTVALTDDFTIRSSVGYLDSEITHVDDGVQGITVGNAPALTPRWTVMVAPSYFIDMASGATVAVNASYSYRSDMQGQSVNNPNEFIESRELFGFNISYTNSEGDTEITLYGENVFNEVYDVGRLQQSGFVGVMRSNDRSEFGLKFRKDFWLD